MCVLGCLVCFSLVRHGDEKKRKERSEEKRVLMNRINAVEKVVNSMLCNKWKYGDEMTFGWFSVCFV